MPECPLRAFIPKLKEPFLLSFVEEDTLIKQNIAQLESAIKIVRKANAVNFLMQKGGGKGRAPGESNFIIGTFEGLKQNLVKNQAENAEVEAKKVGLFDKLAKTKNAQLLALRDDREKKLILIGETKQDLAAAKNDIEDLGGALKEDKTFLAKTEVSCSHKKKAWQIRSEDRAAEKAAIREAISFLVVTFKSASLLQSGPAGFSLLQARVSEHSRASSTDVAMNMLDDTDAELSSMSSDETASSKQERFDAVKKTLQDLVGVLQAEQKEEKTKKDMCESEFQKKGDEKDETSDLVNMTTANIESKDNEVSTIVSEVKEIEGLIADSKKADELASKLRQTARKSYQAGSKDRMMTIKVLTSAMAVLQKFYNSQDVAAMVQKHHEKVSETQPPSFDEGSSRKSGSGNIVISMLEKIIGDIHKEQKDAEIEENQSKTEYEESIKENADAYEVRMEETTKKVIRKARLKVQVGDQKETLGEQKDKLSSVVDQIGALHDTCDELLKSYEKRTKDRNFEIAQIRDVFDILSGSSVAARTGLVQGSEAYDDFSDDSEENKLKDMLRTTRDVASKARQLRK